MRSTIAALTALAALTLSVGSAIADGGGVDPGAPKPGQDSGWVSASAAGVSLRAPGNVLSGANHTVTGTTGAGKRRVALQREVSTGVWKAVAYATTTAAGRYSLTWKVTVVGRVHLRVVAEQRTGTPDAKVSAYHRARATVFGGPGEYQAVACGGRAELGTIGVAHKTLPCGTHVQISYKGRSIVLPVIDRGPYRAGYSWDLTFAAAEYLKMDGLASVGYLVVGKDPGT
jgi:rare lipoprotein A (peptidoglycan hydrolase)